MSGIATPNLPQQPVVDELIGNADGNTVRISLDRLIALVMGGHGPSYETRAGLVADLDWAEGTIATVWGGDEAMRGVYRKRGAAGGGSWARMGDLPGMSTTLAALAAKADAADLADGRVYAQFTANPSGKNIAASADSVVCITSSGITIWQRVAAPSDDVETDVLKRDNGGIWWRLRHDPAVESARLDLAENRGTRAMGSRAEAAARVGDLPETVTRIWHSEVGKIVFRGRGVMAPDALNSDGWGVIATFDPAALSAETQAREAADLEILSVATATDQRLSKTFGAVFDDHGYAFAVGTEDHRIVLGVRTDGRAEAAGADLATVDEVSDTYRLLDQRAPFSAFSPVGTDLIFAIGSESGHLVGAVDGAGVGSFGYAPLGAHVFQTGNHTEVMSYSGNVRQVTNDYPTAAAHWFGPRLRVLETRSGARHTRLIGPDWGLVPYNTGKYPKVAVLCGMGQSLMEGVGHQNGNASGIGVVQSADRSLMFDSDSFAPKAPSNTVDIDLDNRKLVAARADQTREMPTHQCSAAMALTDGEGLFVTNHARGGYNIQQLKKGGTTDIYERWTRRLDSFGLWAAVNDIEISRAIMIWQQGQSGGFSSEQQYRDFLLQMWQDIRGDVSVRAGAEVPTLVVTAPLPRKTMGSGWHPRDTVDLGATGAQLWAALEHPSKFACAGPDYHIARRDGTHMTPEGYALIGAMFARAINRWTATNGAWKPLHIQSAARAGNKVTLTFAGGDGPLIFDVFSGAAPVIQGVREIQNKGLFWYQDGGTDVAISAVAITGPRTITVTLSGDPGATTAEWITTGISGDFGGTNEAFVDGDPATATGGATNIRTNPADPERNTLAEPLYDWACQQIIQIK